MQTIMYGGTINVAFRVLDVLGYLDEIPVCVGYEIDGKVTTDFPVTHWIPNRNDLKWTRKRRYHL